MLSAMATPMTQHDFEIVMHIQGIEQSTFDTLNVFLAPGNCTPVDHETDTSFLRQCFDFFCCRQSNEYIAVSQHNKTNY